MERRSGVGCEKGSTGRAGLFGVVGRVGAARSILLGRWWRRRDRPGPVGDDADPLALAVAGEVALDVDGGAGL